MAERPLYIPFPFLGLDRGNPSWAQPKGTSYDLKNVRGMHFGDSKGGGNRDGFIKAFAEQLDPSERRRIEHLVLFLPSLGIQPSPCEFFNILSGSNGEGRRLADRADGKLYITGTFTELYAPPATLTAQRYLIYDTIEDTWTAPNAFSSDNNNPYGMKFLDNGDGEKLYSAGPGVASSTQRVARGNTTSWTNITGTTANGPVHDIVLFNGNIYACGDFTTIGGVSANRIAMWNGTVWAALGTGLTGGEAYVMEVYDGKLYVGGEFTAAGGSTANCIACWDGSTWAALVDGSDNGVGDDGRVYNLRVHALRTWAGRLYIGGSFLSLSSDADEGHSHITSWNGVEFEPLEWGLRDWGGTDGLTPDIVGVRSIEIFEDDLGDGLWVAGRFQSASTPNNQGLAAPNMAKWNGQRWLVPDVGLDHIIHHALPAGFPDNRRLYAVGSFAWRNIIAANFLASWNGTRWAALGGAGPSSCGSIITGASQGAMIATTLENDATERLYVGSDNGADWGFGETVPRGILGILTGTSLTNSKWSVPKDGSDNLDTAGSAGVKALAVYGGRLYIGGLFTTPFARLTSWDGLSFVDLAGASPSPTAAICAMCVGDAGDGSLLYIGGQYVSAGGLTLNFIGSYNGTAWAQLTDGTVGCDDAVRCLCMFGSLLILGGEFDNAGSVAASRIASWNGATNAFATIGGAGLTNGNVNAVCVFDGDLYAVGSFTEIVGVAAVRIAKWDGANWAALGTGLNATARCMYVWDDGNGDALYIGGEFTAANGVTAYGIVKWNGTVFTKVDPSSYGGVSPGAHTSGFGVRTISEFNGELVIYGQFTRIGGEPSEFLVKGDCVEE